MLIYLASPYTHSAPSVRQHRYEQVLEVTARLIKQGFHVYSPIVHNHFIACQYNLPCEISFWHEYDREFVSHCDELWVLTLDGWFGSKGIKFEISVARELYKPVRMIGFHDSRPHS